MLTEISWWGGLLFLWFAMSYTFVKNEFNKEDSRVSAEKIIFNLTFACSAIILALYFYPLESILMQQGYLASVTLALLSLILMFAWPDSDKGEGEELAAKKKDNEQPKEEDEEELGLIYELLGQGILLLPIIISIALGAYKSLEFVTELGTIS